MIIFVRNLVIKDLWLKLFALALAILIWLTVRFTISGEGSPLVALMGRRSDETVLTVPVVVTGTDAQSVGVDPPDVQITLRGDPALVKSLRIEDIRAQVNLSGVESAGGVLRPIEVVLPPGVAYTHLAPPEVEVRVSLKQ
jgi:hypothetical protein